MEIQLSVVIKILMGSRYFLPILIALLPFTLTEDSTPSITGIDQTILREREAVNLKEDFQRKLNPWVLREIESTAEIETFQATQSFLLQLGAGDGHEFRWKSNTNKREINIKIRTFTQESGDDIVIIKNPEEDRRVDVDYRYDLTSAFIPLEKIYLFKVLKLSLKEGEVFIKVTNTHTIPIILEVSLQGDPTIISPQNLAKNDDFLIPASKLNALMQQMKVSDANRKYLYKWEWGFLQRGKHYDQEMVKLTAAELFIILATSVIQMYCIKGLLDNHQIV